jgi:thioredoxin reductase
MTPPQLPLIIGSGPSGHSAATWLHALGLPFVWIDANATLGGTLLRIHHPLQNVPGLIPPPQDGPAWAASLNQQRASLSVPLSQNTLALSLDLINRVALLSSPQKAALSEVSFSHLVLATGTHPRLPVLPHPWNPQKLLNQVFFFSTNQWGKPCCQQTCCHSRRRRWCARRRADLSPSRRIFRPSDPPQSQLTRPPLLH